MCAPCIMCCIMCVCVFIVSVLVVRCMLDTTGVGGCACPACAPPAASAAVRRLRRQAAAVAVLVHGCGLCSRLPCAPPWRLAGACGLASRVREQVPSSIERRNRGRPAKSGAPFGGERLGCSWQNDGTQIISSDLRSQTQITVRGAYRTVRVNIIYVINYPKLFYSIGNKPTFRYITVINSLQ
jgi:hypothetical protein